jgi:hypothetical protein
LPGSFFVHLRPAQTAGIVKLANCGSLAHHLDAWIFSARRYNQLMKTPVFLPLLASLLLVGCGEKSDKPQTATNAASSGSSPLSAPADYVGALSKAKQSAVKTVDVTSLNQAIQLFNVDKGRNPKDLNELVTEKFIPTIPDAPYGMKLEYDASSGKVSVVKAP